MIYFEVPIFDQQHREQLRAMCAVPPSFKSSKDQFSYLPVDSIYTTGSGLPSFIVKNSHKTNALLTISEDSDVIFTHWHLALFIKRFIDKHQQKWLNQLTQTALPILQHCITNGSSIHPITGLNSLYLTLASIEMGVTDNMWRIENTDTKPNTVYLSSYIHKMAQPPSSSLNHCCPHPFLFLDSKAPYKQHIYAGVNISPCNKNYRTFCERLPFGPLGMQYTPSSWVSVLINKLSHFEPFRNATAIAAKHPDLFSALVVCSVGFPSSLLFDHTNYCSLLDVSKYELCEILIQISPLVDYCTTLMIDESQISNRISYYVNETNPDIQ